MLEARTIVRRAVQSYWRMSRSLTLGAQGVVLDAAERVLLVRHTYRPGWHFPGGGVERNETAREALERELNEEAGVQLDGPPQLFAIYANFVYFPSDHITLFVVRQWRQPLPPGPTREIAEVGFFARDQLPEGVVDPVRRRLREIFEGTPADQDW